MSVSLMILIAIKAWAKSSSDKESKTGRQKYLKSTDRELWLILLHFGGSKSHMIPLKTRDDLLSKTSANCIQTDQEESDRKPA